MIKGFPAETQVSLQRMLNQRYYVVISTPVADADALDAHLPAHIEYVVNLEQDGHLFASGPFIEPNGSPRGRGLMILRAESLDDARRLAARDPFVQAGVRRSEVCEWRFMVGRVSLSLDASVASARLS